jgi:hypothetical protein
VTTPAQRRDERFKRHEAVVAENEAILADLDALRKRARGI